MHDDVAVKMRYDNKRMDFIQLWFAIETSIIKLHVQCKYRELVHLLGKATLSRSFCHPSEKGSVLTQKHLLPNGSYLFPLEKTSFLEGA